MTKKRRIRNFIASMYNVKGWLGYQEVKAGAQTIRNSVATLTNMEQVHEITPSETFTNAMNRLSLTEKDIAEIEHGYYRNFLVFLSVGLIIAIYSIYRFAVGHWLSGWVSMMMMIVIFCFSLASHFWYFQVKHRKLGCTFREWYTNKINI